MILKRTLLISIICILCGAAGFAQNIKDEGTYNRLVDYCNCKFAYEYIHTFYIVQNRNDNLKTECETQILPILKKCRIEEHLTYDSLCKLIKKTQYHKDVVKNYKTKRKFCSEKSDEDLFESLFFKKDPSIYVNFTNISNELRTEIQHFLNGEQTAVEVETIITDATPPLGATGSNNSTATKSQVGKNADTNDSITFKITNIPRSLKEGKTAKIKYEPRNANLKWESTLPNVVAVDSNGKIKATAIFEKEDNDKSATIIVKDANTDNELGRCDITVKKNQGCGFLTWSIVIGLLVLLVVLQYKTKKVFPAIWKIVKYLLKAVRYILEGIIWLINKVLKDKNNITQMGNTDKSFLELKKQHEALNKDYDDLMRQNKSLQQQITNIKSQEKVIDTKTYEVVFKWILKDNKNFRDFCNVILRNEQLCSLWVKNSLKYPEIKEFIEQELLQKNNPPVVTPKVKSSNVVSLTVEPTIEHFTQRLYADSITDDVFNQVRETPNDDTIFELVLRSHDLADFTILHDRHSRVIRRPEFLNGCDKQVIAGGSNVQILQEGTAQRQADGRWKIIKKLNVIIN